MYPVLFGIHPVLLLLEVAIPFLTCMYYCRDVDSLDCYIIACHLAVNLVIRGGRVVRRGWINFHCRGVLLIWKIVGLGPIALAEGAGAGCLDIFSLVHLFCFTFSLSGRRPDIEGR